jgi:hypothetical protein
VFLDLNRLVSAPGSPEIAEQRDENGRVVSHIAERLVAVEAEQATNFPGRVIVIDVVGCHLLATSAQATLLSEHSVIVG